MQGFFKRASWEVCKAVLLSTVICLLLCALFAVFVRAFTPSTVLVTVLVYVFRAVAIFVGCLLFIRSERALIKGMVAGVLTSVLLLFLFALIGGGLHVTLLFPLELILSAVVGGGAGLLGGKLRKS